MGRRIILFLVSFLVVLAGLFVYQLVTSRNQPILPVEVDPPPPLVQQTQGSTHFIERDQTGAITREFGYDKRITDSGEPDTIILGDKGIGGIDGAIQISKPWARIHDKSGRIVEIVAETGTVLLDRPLSEGQIPSQGYLEDVNVTVYQQSKVLSDQSQSPLEFTDTRPSPEFSVLLRERVDFQLEFSRLNCPGKVSVAAPMFAVEGYDLNLEYDQINERLQELRINRIEKLLIVAPKSLAGSVSSAADENHPPQDSTADMKQDNKRAPQLSTYQFSLSDNVEIIQPGGREKMTADSIILIADVDLAQMGRNSSEPNDAGDNPPEAESGDLATEKPATKQSIFVPTVLDPNEVINMMCQGPMVISLMDQSEVKAAGSRLEMTATGRPVQIWRNGRQVVRADEVVFHQMSKTIMMNAGEDRPVRLDWQDHQWITTNEKVLFDQVAGLAEFEGSGEFEFADEKTEGPAHFQYHDTLNFYFFPDPNTEEISLDNLTPQKLEIAGGVRAEYLDNLLIAESISADFTRDPNGQYVPTTVIVEGGPEDLSLANQIDGYQVLGRRIEGDVRDNIWKIIGEPARLVRLDKPEKLEGPVILADLNLNRFEIVEPGTIQAQLSSDIFQFSSDVPADLLVKSTKGIFDADTGRIEIFDANAIVEQVDTVRKATRVDSPQITIDLIGEPNQTGFTSGMQLSALRAHGGLVFIAHNEYDPNSNDRLRTMMMETQELKFDDPNQQMVTGPGWIISADYRTAQPEYRTMQPSVNQALPGVLGRRGPSQVLIQFGRRMQLDQLAGELTFDGGVVVDYQPLVIDSQAMEPAFTATLADMKRLTCEKMCLTFTEETQTVGSELTAMGNLQQVTASGRVYTEATFKDNQAHIIAGENLVYDIATETIRLTGTFAQPVYLDGLPCSLIQWNVKDGSFIVKNIGSSK